MPSETSATAIALDIVGSGKLCPSTVRGLKEHELGAKSINNVLSALRAPLAHAAEHEVIAAVPKFKWQKPPPSRFDFFTLDECGADAEAKH